MEIKIKNINITLTEKEVNIITGALSGELISLLKSPGYRKRYVFTMNNENRIYLLHNLALTETAKNHLRKFQTQLKNKIFPDNNEEDWKLFFRED